MIPAVIERCAGIDVGKKFLAVCVMVGPASEEGQAELRKFGTIRRQLVALREWLKSEGITQVVMESTGVYWRPVLNVLEDDPEYSLRIVFANPQQVKAVTGHKTDPHDARWLAHLLRHGMIRPSFIPPRPIRELREFTRRRKQMIGIAADERNRVQNVLEDANVKTGDVWRDVCGRSGQLMLEGAGGRGDECLRHRTTGAKERSQEDRGASGGFGRTPDATLPSDSDPACDETYGISHGKDRCSRSGDHRAHPECRSEPTVGAAADPSRHAGHGGGNHSGREWSGHENRFLPKLTSAPGPAYHVPITRARQAQAGSYAAWQSAH